MKSNIATSDKSIVNPLIINDEIVAYLPLEIPDKTEELAEKHEQEVNRLKDQANAEERTREIVEAINSQKNIEKPTRDYWYEAGQLKFELQNGGIDQFDFSKADKSRKYFEAFWYLWQGDGKGEYSLQQVRDKYRQKHKEEPGEIGKMVSLIRPSIINKKISIRDRITWEFDRKKQKWIFRISSK